MAPAPATFGTQSQSPLSVAAPGAIASPPPALTLHPSASQTFNQPASAGYPVVPSQIPGVSGALPASASAMPQSHLHPHLSPITTQPIAGLPSPNSIVPPPVAGSTLGTYCPALPGAGLPPQTCWSAPGSMSASPVPFAPAGLRSRLLPSMARPARTTAEASEVRPSPLACPLLTDPATRTHTPGWNDPPPLSTINAAAATTAATTASNGSNEVIASAPPADANAPEQ